MIRRFLKTLTDTVRKIGKPAEPSATAAPPAAPPEARPVAPEAAPERPARRPRPRRRPAEGQAAERQAGSPAPAEQAEKTQQRKRRSRGGRKPEQAEQAAPARPAAPPQPAPVTATAWEPAQFQVEPAEGKTRFHDLDLPPALMRAIADLGFQYCTPVQAQSLPHTLAGHDATGRAQTGTGKTAAFLVTIFTRLLREPSSEERKPGTPRALVLAPTRELVMQIGKEADELGKYTGLRVLTVFGGMDYRKQQAQLGAGPVDIVIATPGRLLDFQRRRDVHLGKVEILVLDEADRMLDMGFIPDVRTIIHSTPPKTQRQTLLFSATIDDDVTRLIRQWTREPVVIEVESEQVAADTVEQMVYIVTSEQKFVLLYNLITQKDLERVIIFVNQRGEARRLADRLHRHKLRCAILSGDVPQVKRVKTLEDFRAGKIRVLVATDVAGRGIHVEGVSHVVNYNLPMDAEDYVHRIGRTGRAGQSGVSVSFACEEEAFQIPDIEAFLGRSLTCTYPEENLLAEVPQAEQPAQERPQSRPRSGNRARGPRRPREERREQGRETQSAPPEEKKE